jgi:hypothetical protein
MGLTLEQRRELGRKGGEATRDKMRARDPDYYSAIRSKRRPSTLADGEPLRRVARTGLGGRIQRVRRELQERIDRGTLSRDDADRYLLTNHNVTMEPKVREAGKRVRRRELGLE